ncbi:MAG TPA: type II toxin-antitoxin system VapC family toxin [Terracidiphilus sp.]|nr:type II toxin-antitoxin system VapC family toxin [Terracidiphilus sp.]
MTVLLDSDIIIEILRRRDDLVLAQWSELAASDVQVLTSPVSVAEIEAGARPSEMGAIQQFFSLIECSPIDESVGRRAGELMRRYSRSHGVEIADALIAATAIHRQAALWTRNRKHYPMPELVVYG